MRLEAPEFSSGITVPCVHVIECLLLGTDCAFRQCYVCEFCTSSLSLWNKSLFHLPFKKIIRNYQKWQDNWMKS